MKVWASVHDASMSNATLAEKLNLSTQCLAHEFDTARLDAEVLISHALAISRTQLYTRSNRVLSEREEQVIDDLIARRTLGEPVAYIVGKQEFWSLDFVVTPATLIPRPETELIVEIALTLISENQACRVLDLGTGSGAIAIAIATERKLCEVVAIDKSEKALAVAVVNAEKLNSPNVAFIKSDWFEKLGDDKFDLIISNPPYIESHDQHLNRGDVRFEPSAALISGKDGLNDFRQIISQAKNYLKPSGFLLLEHGWGQAAKVERLFKQYCYDDITMHADLSGNERVTVAVNT